jgi:DNA-binding NarL/FixJ family response regulator
LVKLNLLIAEPCDLPRTGLCTIFQNDERVEHVYEAATKEDLQTCLRTSSFDLVIANPSLMTDLTMLPRGRFVIVAEAFDKMAFKMAYTCGAKGYLLYTTPAEILRTTLDLAEGGFLVEPILSVEIVKDLSSQSRFAIKEELLTRREREIVRLLREGVDRHTIAQQLYISEATLKTHIKNIMRKRRKNSDSSALCLL